MKKKKNKKTRFYFVCPIFKVDVCLNLGTIDREKPPVIFNAEYIPKEDSIAECTAIENDKKTILAFHVWVKDKTDYYSMVHETLHLVEYILSKKGIPFNSENQELIAYYQGYWVRKFWNKMSKFI